ncbi:MAG: hypothetical protein FJ399_10415, partial [Verrucomicrobia bacterium]|nr:hypothetical protein [Verrucomicrobiota bacterium]
MKPNASSRLVACFALSVAGVCGPRLAGAGAGPVESGVAAAPQRADAAIPTLDQGFVTPPRAARPYTYWMWLAEAPRECITRDLEEFHAKGIVGVLIYPSSMGPIWYPGHKVVLEGKEYRKVETAEYGGKSAGAGIKPM